MDEHYEHELHQDFFKKKFSVGLCLNEPISHIDSFLESNQKWLNSVYFSLPLGRNFLSRESLENEYDGNEEKLHLILSILSQKKIRREMAINTWDLTEDDLERAILYCRKYQLYPEEIVCLKEYGEILSKAFPDAEIKYSVNNPESDGSGITDVFHTLVAGKGLLRDIKARHQFLDKGYGMTLLLNNGCLSICNTVCETIQCHRYFDYFINKNGLDYTYANCSFFPSELKALIMYDKYADYYKFKISNRPLGLEYTQHVLNSYLELKDNIISVQNDYKNLALFCTVHPLAIRLHDIDLGQVLKLKESWILEFENEGNWTKQLDF